MDSYKKRLDEMLATITLDLKAIGIHNPQNASDWVAVPEELDAEEPDVNLAADAIEEWNERTALVATLEHEYNSIVSALARIESNTFGNCEVCGKAIEESRQSASPIARTCIAHREEESHI